MKLRKMLFSILQVESRVDNTQSYPETYTPIPQDIDIEKITFQTNLSDQFFGTPCQIVTDTLGLLSLLMFCIIFPIAQYYHYSYPPCSSNSSPPRIFLNSLSVSTFNISQGELSTTLNTNITISNGINSTLIINILNFHALIVYKNDKALAQNSPIVNQENVDSSGVFVIHKNENKILQLTFNTTGWEKDQPIVDDDAIQEIIDEQKLRNGVVSFGLKMLVEAEVNYSSMKIPIVMEPYCLDLEVDLAPLLEHGEAAKLNDVGEGIREYIFRHCRMVHEQI